MFFLGRAENLIWHSFCMIRSHMLKLSKNIVKSVLDVNICNCKSLLFSLYIQFATSLCKPFSVASHISCFPTKSCRLLMWGTSKYMTGSTKFMWSVLQLLVQGCSPLGPHTKSDMSAIILTITRYLLIQKHTVTGKIEREEKILKQAESKRKEALIFFQIVSSKLVVNMLSTYWVHDVNKNLTLYTLTWTNYIEVMLITPCVCCWCLRFSRISAVSVDLLLILWISLQVQTDRMQCVLTMFQTTKEPLFQILTCFYLL